MPSENTRAMRGRDASAPSTITSRRTANVWTRGRSGSSARNAPRA